MWESIDIHSAGHHRGDKVLAGLVLPTPTSLSYFHSRMAHRCRHGVLAGGSGMTNRNSCQPAPNDHIDGHSNIAINRFSNMFMLGSRDYGCNHSCVCMHWWP